MVTPLNVEHNFLVPAEMNVNAATALIVKAIHDEYPQVSVGAAESNRLIQASTGKALNRGCSFKQLGIAPGEKILLM